MESYNPQVLEPKWQQYWLDNRLFAAADDTHKKKMYVLDMFPYPSGDGLHVGHAKIYTASDIVARYLRMKGFNVLHPTGWDAFGLPTENSAIKLGIHPAELTKRNVARFRQQMQRLGLSYDWEREINTTDPQYYKWTQWIFLRLYKMGLAYEATVPINWCPSCLTGLANEEVVDGKCERCGTAVEQRPLRQWMLRITRYADQLLQGLGGLDWPQFIIELQQNWIGRSEGAEIIFTLDQSSAVNPQAMAEKLTIKVFTTRPETIYGATYVVVAPEHPLVGVITTPQQREAVTTYVAQTKQRTEVERTDVTKEKTGVFTGAYVLHPLTHEPLPVWVADYVLLAYGTGAIMAVPAHDERDFAFATKYNLPIVQVISPVLGKDQAELPYSGDGVLINSDQSDGQEVAAGRQMIMGLLQQRAVAQKAVIYKLRDWVFSRQRYWGEPIPLIHCKKCGVVPVPEKDLPVELPPIDTYQPTGTGESPLAAIESWVQVKCPTCPNIARRETNTMPQWAGSSWYFLRYTDPHNKQALAAPEKMQWWLPVDVYMGGAEHAVLHLLYARFWIKALRDAGVISLTEPFSRLRSVGLVMGEDGQKMSKSRGNVVNPDEVVAQYGADTLRLYAMFMGPFSASGAWNTGSIAGVHRFLKRVWQTVLRLAENSEPGPETTTDLEVLLQQTIKRVSENTENFKFNTAIAALMEFHNFLEKQPHVSRSVLERFILVLSPYAPYISEELWQRLGQKQSVLKTAWPGWKEQVLQPAVIKLPVQVNGKLRATIEVAAAVSEEHIVQAAQQQLNVARYLSQGTVARVVYVPGRLLNFVLKE
ncbi:MAG: leucine--tRNA ligase [Candidatus Andersenbacteria bacterium]